MRSKASASRSFRAAAAARRTWTIRACASGSDAFSAASMRSDRPGRSRIGRRSTSKRSAVEPRRFLIDHAWLPRELAGVYAGVSQQALDGVARCYERAGDVEALRLHGDCHEGNVLWTDSPGNTGPHFVDFDDSRTGPAVQDLWMLLGADRDEQTERLSDMLAGLRGLRRVRSARTSPDRGAAHAAPAALLGLDRAALGRSGVPGRVPVVQHAALLGRADPRTARAGRRDAGAAARGVGGRHQRFRPVRIA